MWQRYLNPVCPFCDSVFSNYEEVVIDFWKAVEEQEKYLTSDLDYDIIKERKGKEKKI